MRLWTAMNQGNWLVTRIHDMFWGFGAPQTSGGGETWFTGVHPDLIWSQVSMTKMKKIGLKICPEMDFFLTSIGKPDRGKSIRHVFFHFWLKIRCQPSSNISLQRAKSAKNTVFLSGDVFVLFLDPSKLFCCTSWSMPLPALFFWATVLKNWLS